MKYNGILCCCVLPLVRKWDTPTNHNRRSLQTKQEKKRESISADRPSDSTYLLRRVESKIVSGGGHSATARRWQQLGGCVAAVAVSVTVAAARQHDVGRSLAAVAASAAVAAAQSAAAVHSATAAARSVAAAPSVTAAARLQQRGYCGGGGSATARCRRQLGGSRAVVTASAAVVAARSDSAMEAARLQQREYCKGGGSATLQCWRQLGGGAAAVAVSAAVAAA